MLNKIMRYCSDMRVTVVPLLNLLAIRDRFSLTVHD